jgi:hypothetical protein
MKFNDINVYNNIINSLTEEIDKLLKRPLHEQILPSTEFAGDMYGDDEGSDEDKLNQRKASKEWTDPLLYASSKWDTADELSDSELKSLANPLSVVKLTANDWKALEQMSTREAIVGFRLEHADHKGKIVLSAKIKKIKVFGKPLLEWLLTWKAARTIKTPTGISSKTPGYCHCAAMVNKYDHTGMGVWSEIKNNMKAEAKGESKVAGKAIKKSFNDCVKAFGDNLKNKNNRDKITLDCDTYEEFLVDMKSMSSKIGGLLGQFYRIKNQKEQNKSGGRGVGARLAAYKLITFKNTSGTNKQASDGATDCCMDNWPDEAEIEFKPTGTIGGGDGKTVKGVLTGSIRLNSSGSPGATSVVLITFQKDARTQNQNITLKFRNSSGVKTGKDLAVTGHITSLT